MLFEKIYKEKAIMVIGISTMVTFFLTIFDPLLYSKVLPAIGYFWFFMMYEIMLLIALLLIIYITYNYNKEQK